MYAFLICVCCLIVFFYQYHKWKYRDIDKLPGPPALPIIGNVLEYGSNTEDVLSSMKRLIEQYGGLVRMWIGPVPNIIITDVRFVEYFLSSNVHIDKTSSYDLFKPLLGSSSVVRPGDEKWRFLRKKLTPAFHFKILEQFFSVFNSAGAVLIKNLEAQIHKESVDIAPYLTTYALDVLCQTSMGVQTNVQNDPNNEYVKALAKYEEIFTMRQFSIVKRSKYLFYFFKNYKIWTESIKTLQNFSRKVIKERREQRKHKRVTARVDEFGIKDRPTFLELLLEAADEKNQLTDEEIRQEVDTTMIAGHDTTANATSFAIFELAKHQHIQERILEESNEYLGADKNATISFSTIQNMKFLDLVCKESLRMYPGVPVFERSVKQDVYFEGIKIPKDTIITIPILWLHRSEKIFSDPEKFDPDRFLPENCTSRNPFAYIPFSAGPRNCIGQRYALLEMKATLVKLIRNFKFYPVDPEHKLRLGAQLVLRSVNGVPVGLIPRF